MFHIHYSPFYLMLLTYYYYMSEGYYTENTTGAEFSKWITEMEGELEFFKMSLAGLEMNDNGDYIKLEGQEELINAAGRDVVISFLRSLLTKNTFMSDISVERAHDLCRFLSVPLRDKLFLRRFDYNIRDMVTWDEIVSKTQTFMELALKRAVEGRERELSLSQHQTSTQIVNDNRPQRKGILDGILPHTDRMTFK